MQKKLLGCAMAAVVTVAGSFYLASPAQAAAMAGCPDGWQKACGTAPPGCYIAASCVAGPGGTPFITCEVHC